MTKARGWEAIYESGLADLARWAPEGIEARRDGEVLEFRRGERVIYAAANPYLERKDHVAHVVLWSSGGARIKLVGSEAGWDVYTFENLPLRMEWTESRVRQLIADLLG